MNKTLLLRMVAAAAFFLGGICALEAQNTGRQLYGITFLNNQIITIDTNSGQGTVVGNLDTTISGYGIAARYGQLYAFSPVTDQIVEIDPNSGGIKRYISIGVTNLTGEGDLAFRSDGVGFLSSALHPDGSVANDLYTFDIIGRTSQRIGTTTLAIDALAFDSSGNLYALAKDDDNLYLVNQTSGALTAVGPLGVVVESPYAGMTFGPDGRLYAAINDQLYILNPSTGAATAVESTNGAVDIGFSSVSGLAFQTPEPITRLVGTSFIQNQLFAVDPKTGMGTFVGSLGTNVSPYGIATYSNVLYTFDPNIDKILSLNPTTGSALKTIDIGVTNLQGEGDLAFRSDGTGFLASALHPDGTIDNGLYAFNVSSGTSFRVGTTPEAVDALAFDTNNTLYALGQDDDMLYTVNTNSAVMSAVGPLGVNMATPYAGMTFGPDGTLYAAINDDLYLIDKQTGAASVAGTNVVDFGFSSVSGLAFAPAPARLNIVMEGGNAVIYYVGNGYTLQSAPTPIGPFTNTRFQTPITRIPPNVAQMYFRLVEQ